VLSKLDDADFTYLSQLDDSQNTNHHHQEESTYGTNDSLFAAIGLTTDDPSQLGWEDFELSEPNTHIV
jgi:hypothetical protein